MSASEVNYKELYVQELDYSRCSGTDDLEEMVYAHCTRKGMTPVDLCMIPVRGTRTKAGCKVTINDADYQRESRWEFWPRGADVRDWEHRPKKKDREYGDSDNPNQE